MPHKHAIQNVLENYLYIYVRYPSKVFMASQMYWANSNTFSLKIMKILAAKKDIWLILEYCILPCIS